MGELIGINFATKRMPPRRALPQNAEGKRWNQWDVRRVLTNFYDREQDIPEIARKEKIMRRQQIGWNEIGRVIRDNSRPVLDAPAVEMRRAA